MAGPVSRRSHFNVMTECSVLPGCETEVLGHLAELALATRIEPGSIGYDYFQSVENPRHILIVERYVTEADFSVHLASAHFAVLGKALINPLLADRKVLTFKGDGPTR
nr:putative quinol monooxygenase [Gordonia sp. SID5947]